MALRHPRNDAGPYGPSVAQVRWPAGQSTAPGLPAPALPFTDPPDPNRASSQISLEETRAPPIFRRRVCLKDSGRACPAPIVPAPPRRSKLNVGAPARQVAIKEMPLGRVCRPEASHKNAIADSLQGAIPAAAHAPTEALLFPVRSASFRPVRSPLTNKPRVH